MDQEIHKKLLFDILTTDMNWESMCNVLTDYFMEKVLYQIKYPQQQIILDICNKWCHPSILFLLHGFLYNYFFTAFIYCHWSFRFLRSAFLSFPQTSRSRCSETLKTSNFQSFQHQRFHLFFSPCQMRAILFWGGLSVVLRLIFRIEIFLQAHFKIIPPIVTPA